MQRLCELVGRNQTRQNPSTQKDTFDFQKEIRLFDLGFLKSPGSVPFPVQFANLVIKINKNWENIFHRDTAITMLKTSWDKLDGDTQARFHEVFPLKKTKLQTPLHDFIWNYTRGQ